MIEKIINNEVVFNNIIMLICVLCFFSASVFLNRAYNNSGRKVTLIISRVFIVAALLTVAIWFFK